MYYFVKISNFLYHLLAESDSSPSSAYILSLLVSQIAPGIAKHGLYFLILIRNLPYQVCHILYLRNLNVDERFVYS